MNKNPKTTARYWSGLTISAIALILIGILIVLVTFLTIIGPIFGLILITGGVYLLTLASQAKTRRFDSTAGQPPAEKMRSTEDEKATPVESHKRDFYSGEPRKPGASSRWQSRNPAHRKT